MLGGEGEMTRISERDSQDTPGYIWSEDPQIEFHSREATEGLKNQRTRAAVPPQFDKL